jgi:alkylation response protein AidB-like acyl-CoA dehydrogenase
MDFDLSQEQRMLKQTASVFLKNECPKDLVKEMDESGEGYSADLWGKMAELGWMGLMLPEQYGGSGMSFLDLTVLLEEIGHNICPGPFFSTVVLGCIPILAAASEEQKRAILPRVAAGDLILTMAVTEPSARYDAASVQVVAVPHGDEYLLSGTKLFVPDAHVADYILCAARTRRSPEPEEGITMFLVEGNAPGLAAAPLKTIARDKQCEVVFSEVPVRSANVLGEVDLGWPVVRDTLEKAAVARCAEMVGGARGAMEMALEYAKERVQFDQPIGSFQAVQHHLANMWIAVAGARHLTYQAAWRISEGLSAADEVAMAKAHVGSVYRRVTTLAHQIFGAIGFTMEHDLHLYHRRAVTSDLTFGNADVHLERVAVGLGL